MGKDNHIPIRTQGTSVLSKFRTSLSPEFFGIDERRMSDILAFMVKYSESVRYVNLNNKEDGNWSPFFRSNLAFVIATIASTHLDFYDAKFKKALRVIDDEVLEDERIEALKVLLEVTYELFEIVDQWHKLSRHDLVHLEENRLADHLQNAIKTKLAPQLETFRLLSNRINDEFFTDEKQEFDYDGFDYAWDVIHKFDSIHLEVADTFEFKKAIKDISRVYKSIFSIVTYLQNKTPDLLEHVLTKYPHHSPHVSLMVAFVKVFGHVQRDLNKLTGRHLDFYYKQILKQKPKESEPDRVHVYFNPAEHIVKSIIPAGTLLSAGIDEEGLEYTYATDHSLELNQARITDINIIHVAKNPIIGVGQTFSSVSNIYSRSVKIDDQGQALDAFNNPAPFDSFGKDQVDTSFIQRDMVQAKNGFALSSSVLLLKEGERSISLKYTFNLNSLSALISFIEEFTKKEKLSPENAFYKLLNHIFNVRFTTETGWYEVENYEILPPESWTSGEIKIEMLLDVADPAVSSYNEEIHGGGYNTQWPVLEFNLSSRHSMYAYSYLKDLIIEECKINVQVQKAKDLHVYNDLGKLDITKPFYPFGSTPDVGSYFLVGNEEMFKKNITDLSVEIHWHNLPKVKGGFKTYYKDYDNDIDNDSFKLGISGLSDFRFHPVDEKDVQRLTLFNYDKSKDRLSEIRRIDDIDLEKLELKPDYKEMELSDYTGKTRSGFLRFEVLEPEEGFGFAEYPRLFANAVMENSKASSGLLSKAPEKVDLPNEPYAPQIRTISMHYSASSTLIMDVNKVADNDKFSNDKIYHLHPFGNSIMFENGLPHTNTLVPQFDDEGYLIIGLENVQPPVELSLYFELEDNVKNEINYSNIPKTNWRYLVNDEWIDFEENEVIFDGTNNFTTSGNVRLKVPSVFNAEHNILPKGKFWLSVSTEHNAQILSKTIMVKANGVSATWRAHKPGEQWKSNFPANSITGLFESRSDVNGVNQPFPSFGGRAVESDNHFYTRVSERLKHKNRAVTPDNFEEIILDSFPFVFQAKCINHTSHPDYVKKGHVKIIVVPKLEQTETFYAPKVNYNRLGKIEEHIKEMASSYANIEVVNPVYERVKVSFRVCLKSHSNSGEYVKRLENDLRKFICPWFNTKQGEMNFGGSIERDDILSFIESLNYVKFVTKLSVIVLHYTDGKFDIIDSASNEGKTNELQSSAPWSVLIPSANHEIELIDKPAYETALETRIDTMKIGDDFVITDEKEDEVAFPHFDLDKDTFYAIEIDI